MDTHDASSTAVQTHPAGIDTAMLPVADAAATDTPVGEMVAVHGMPACVTVNAWPAIVTMPAREEIVVFAAML
jgi:D-serine deaminase-like pyridoxal phosphate-dependent protein